MKLRRLIIAVTLRKLTVLLLKQSVIAVRHWRNSVKYTANGRKRMIVFLRAELIATRTLTVRLSRNISMRIS